MRVAFDFILPEFDSNLPEFDSILPEFDSESADDWGEDRESKKRGN